jgi:TPP-dependent trihydroxycyclohexane-1,2-dione (THcHDO) dehydratase
MRLRSPMPPRAEIAERPMIIAGGGVQYSRAVPS